MDLNTSLAVWGIVASIVSVILGLLAVGLAVWFFIAGRKTETSLTASLTKIETQAEALQKLAGRQLDRLTRFVTDRSPVAEDSIPELVRIVALIPQAITASLHQGSLPAAQQQQLLGEIVTAYIAIYFYSAQTNYWSQYYLPGPAEYDETNALHTATRRVVDTSAADVARLEQIINQVDPKLLEASPVYHLLTETRSLWRNFVKSSADVYIARQRAAGAQSAGGG